MSEIRAKLVFGECVVTCRDRSMSGEQSRCPHELKCLAHLVVLLLHILTESFETCESGVSLVIMIHRRVQSQRTKRPHATDTQQNLLLQAVFVITAIELVGHATVFGRIGLVIGIQKVEVRAAHCHFPDAGIERAARQVHTYALPDAVFADNRLCRNLEEVLCGVVSDLIALRGKSLRKITVPVKQTYRHQIHVHIGSFLQIVAGQYTQTTGINLQRGVQSILHTEICHRRLRALVLFLHIGIELVDYTVHSGEEILILCKLVISLKAYFIQNFHRVMPRFMPQFCINALEKSFRVIIPAPPQVLAKHFKTCKLLRQMARHHHAFPRWRQIFTIIHITTNYLTAIASFTLIIKSLSTFI